MWRVRGLISVSGLFAGMASASAQTEPATQPPPSTLPGITVTATKMDEERSSILPSLGATKYDFSRTAIQNTPQGENAPLNQVLLRAPGVVQDGFGQIHVRGDHGSLQYRLDGVQLPEGLSLFSQILSPRFANSLSLLTGALPAQYGLRTAGVVDIGVKSGTTNPGAEASFMGGSYNWVQPSAQYGGRSGNIDYFAVGQYVSNSIGIENPTPTWTPIHDDTAQWYALAKVTGIVDENTRLSFIGGGASARYQIPNNINQVPNFTVFGNSTWDSSILDQRQWESTYFGIASLQKSYQDFNMQLSGFARYSQLNYSPTRSATSCTTASRRGRSAPASPPACRATRAGRSAPRHTVRGGFLIQRERVTSFAQGNTLPLVPDPADPDAPAIPGDQPVGLTDSSDLTGWTYSVYLQDEWKVLPTVTVNAGLRFDAITGTISENQLSPRVNVVWEPTPEITLRAGYARYFVPAPLNQVSVASIAPRAGTSAARGHDQRSGPRRALRLHRRRPDREARRRPHLRLQRLLQVGRELPRQGPVRRTDLPDRLQLLERPGAWFRALRQLRQGPVVALRQPRLVAGQRRSTSTRPSSTSSRRNWTSSPTTGSSPTITRAGRARRAQPTCSTWTRTGRPGFRPTCFTATACARRS